MSKIEHRVIKHRTRVQARGSKRVEVTVPAGDAVLVKEIAGTLRAGGKAARRIRETLHPLLSTCQAKTGAELVEFFRKSPLAEFDVAIEGDDSTGRSIDL